MQEITSFGISVELRQCVEALIEYVVLEGGIFENQKKYLRRFCEEGGVDYDLLETNLTKLFKSAEELKARESNDIRLHLLSLGKDCYISNDIMERIISAIDNERNENVSKLRIQEEARRKACEEAERKAKEEAERIARAEAQRKAKEEAERREREEQARIAEAEAKHKAEEEMKRSRQEELEGYPFNKFPNVQKELMTVVGSDDYYSYYCGYKDILEKTLQLCDDVCHYLDDEDVKQARVFSSFKSMADSFLSQVKNVHCKELQAMRNRGENLVDRGRMMGYTARDERKRAALNNLKRKRTRIALIWTIVVALLWLVFIWGRIREGEGFWMNHLGDYPVSVQIVVGILFFLPATMGLFAIPFLWSKDFRTKE